MRDGLSSVVINSSRTHFKIFFGFPRGQLVAKLMRPDSVVVMHQVLAEISLSLLPGHVTRGRWPPVL